VGTKGTQTLSTGIARSIAGAMDFGELLRNVAMSLQLEKRSRGGLRLWLLGDDTPEPLVCYPPGAELPHVDPSVVSDAIQRGPMASARTVFLPLEGSAGPLAVLEIRGTKTLDRELAAEVVQVAGARIEGLLAAQRQRVLLPSVPVAADANEIQEVITAFAGQAKQLLDHDRLSIYLLTPDGTALERFGVATSPIVPGEGDVLPLEQVGLTRVVKMNAPLVSSDFGVDDRIRGLEDSIIARAGFHGLVSVPLRVGGKPFGLLNFVSKKIGFYSEADIDVAQQIADHISVFLQNLRLQYAVRSAVEREAVTRERNRVAREFHDTVAQTLSKLSARAAALTEDPSLPEEGALRDHAMALRDLSRDALEDGRRALQNLSPSQLEDASLVEAIDAELAQLQREARLSISSSINGDLGSLPKASQIGVFRIFCEAVNNVRRHANATSVSIKIRVEDADMQMSIKDNGKGIYGEPSTPPAHGLGLETMHERAKALGGRLVVSSAAGSGTDVFLHLPRAAEDEMTPAPGGRVTLPRPSTPILRVVVIDDHPTFREGLRQVIQSDETMRVVGETGTGREGLTEIESKRPDVVLLDLHLPDCSGIDLAQQIIEVAPTTAIVMMSAFAEEANIGDALRAGARGYLAKSVSPATLLDSIRTAFGGETVVLPAVSQTQGAAGEALTVREIEILKHLALGKTNAEIGRELHLADKTVERVVATIASKLRAKNRAHAVAKGISKQLIDVRDA
jgi:signal transduction histidine kinase/DNA-binding NarL/FixJ family response regulator